MSPSSWVLGRRMRSLSSCSRVGYYCSTSLRRTVHHGSTGDRKSTPWERKALQVKDKDLNNRYLEAIRDTHDPSMQLKTLEDELKGTIGKALGRQGEKIVDAVKRMQKQYANYERALQNNPNNPNHPTIVMCAEHYNELQKQAVQARWELIVHRQAVGMIVQNHKFVMDRYPIPGPIPIPRSSCNNDDGSCGEEIPPAKEKKVFGDQLDWWEKIGRWK